MTKPSTVTVYQRPYFESRGERVNGQYVAHLDRKGTQWRWRLVNNGNIISTSSEGYHRRIRALRGVEISLRVKPGSLQRLMPGDSKTIRSKYGDVTVRVEGGASNG